MNEWREVFNDYAKWYSNLTGRYAYYEHQKDNGNWLVVGTTKLISEANGNEAWIFVSGYKEASAILYGIIVSIQSNGYEKYNG